MKPAYPPRNGKRALVTDITGQDGSYLAELLLSNGYEVIGTIRRSSSFNTSRIDHIYQDPQDEDVRLRLVYGDLSDASSLNQLVKSIRPDETYNLGAQSHVRVSFEIPEYTSDVTGLGCVRLLEAIREADVPCRFYQASSSEQYGKVVETPQTERTPFNPRSPYACAKAFAFYAHGNAISLAAPGAVTAPSWPAFAVLRLCTKHSLAAGQLNPQAADGQVAESR
jgi:GDPmannose 4,6-dehydratase